MIVFIKIKEKRTSVFEKKKEIAPVEEIKKKEEKEEVKNENGDEDFEKIDFKISTNATKKENIKLRACIYKLFKDY